MLFISCSHQQAVQRELSQGLGGGGWGGGAGESWVTAPAGC